MERETEFLLRRASQEARRAINCDQPEAAQAHDEMARRYSARAVAALHKQDGSAGDPAGG
ncbi:MAG TPA: hypothetical protein VGR19_11585 [Allosphingosinicella sp.]|nr:hypothetical protein [Allosphingosinicella sp.]